MPRHWNYNGERTIFGADDKILKPSKNKIDAYVRNMVVSLIVLAICWIVIAVNSEPYNHTDSAYEGYGAGLLIAPFGFVALIVLILSIVHILRAIIGEDKIHLILSWIIITMLIIISIPAPFSNYLLNFVIIAQITLMLLPIDNNIKFWSVFLSMPLPILLPILFNSY